MTQIITSPQIETLLFILTDGAAFVGTDLGLIDYFPFAATITNLILSVDIAPTGSSLVVDVNINNNSILSTKISVDATEFNSTTAAVPFVLTTTSIALGAELSIDIDQRGATIAGSNVQLILYCTRL